MHIEKIKKIIDGFVRDFQKSGVSGTEILLPQHWATAAINGFCPRDMYFNSLFNWESYQRGQIVRVTANEDILLFLYLMRKANIQLPTTNIFQTCKFSNYEEYVNLMQKIAREFRAHPDNYLKRTAELVAYLHCGMTNGYIHLGSMLHIKRFDGSAAVIRLPKNMEAKVILSGKNIFIPGCGLSILRHFDIMRQKTDINFLLNDINPFIAAVISQVIKLERISNIQIHAGNLADCPLPNNIGLAIFSLLHFTGEDSFSRLAINMSLKMAQGGNIVGFFPDLENAPMNSKKCIDIFSARGFRLLQQEKITYQKTGADIDETILEKSAVELMQMFRNLQKPSAQTGFYFLLAYH